MTVGHDISHSPRLGKTFQEIKLQT